MSLHKSVSFECSSPDMEEAEEEGSVSRLGLQSHWDAAYAEELINFNELGDVGEVWFGEDLMETMASWTAEICSALEEEKVAVAAANPKEGSEGGLTGWAVLDLGTGNGLFLHALARLGFTDLTGTDYSEGAVELANAVAESEGFKDINFIVDDVLQSKLSKTFRLITDKGTLDAIGLHPNGPAHRVTYWKEVARLLEPGGVMVITSCNSTKNELVEEVNGHNWRMRESGADVPLLEYIDHVKTYPTIRFGGVEGSRVCTVAFLCKMSADWHLINDSSLLRLDSTPEPSADHQPEPVVVVTPFFDSFF